MTTATNAGLAAAAPGTAEANVVTGNTMRKTQSEAQIYKEDSPPRDVAPAPAQEATENDDGCASDSALHGQPRERKKGE